MFVLKLVQSSRRFVNNPIRVLTKNTHSENRAALNLVSDDNIKVNVHGECLEFPQVWLRDNCQCRQCFHPTAKSRTIDWSKTDLNVKATSIQTDADFIDVAWSDGHVSKFQLDWLRIRSFAPKHQDYYNKHIYKPSKITWHGDQFQTICSQHDYQEILDSEETFYEFLLSLSVYGVALVENSPKTDYALKTLVDKIAFPRQTHYGVQYVVQNVPNTSNVAYQSSKLQMHTDLPYYDYCPGVNLLHCLEQTIGKGGDNELADTNYAANYMRKHHPEDFHILSTIEVEWTDIGVENGKEFFKLHRAPVICLDNRGNINRINFSIPQRGTYFPTSIDNVRPWYEAHQLFLELNNQFKAKIKTKPGDILAFDNVRLLHGREAYEDQSDNVRKLIGTYIDWDEIYSMLRCLKLRLYSDDCKGI